MPTVDDQAALERAVLTGIIRHPKGRHEALATVRPSDFQASRHRTIFAAVAELVAEEAELSALAITDHLDRHGTLKQAGGSSYVGELANGQPHDPAPLATRLVESSRRRALSKVGERLALRSGDRRMALDELVGTVVDEIIAAGTTDDGIVRADDVREGVEELWDHGLEPGPETGWPSLNPFYRPAAGYWTVVTGIPSHGKSTVLDCMSVNLAIKHGWRFVVFSPENFPVRRHAAALIQSRSGKPIDALRHHELRRSLDWVNEHYTWIDPNETTSLRGIIARTQALHAKSPVNGLIIDPWNEVEHRAWHEGEKETDYISTALTQVRRAARTMNIHTWLVAHPKKLEARRDGTEPVPEPYDISGSANWRNKADFALTVYRDKQANPLRTEVHIQKVRMEEHGREGVALLDFNPKTRNFRSPGEIGVEL